MINTSETFAPFAIEREVDCNIRFELLDENAKDNADPSASDQDISQLDQLTDGVTTTGKYASLELNSWVLDGSFNILPDDTTAIQAGWWSSLSDIDAVFETPPVLSVYFGGEAISTVGFTMYFDDAAGVPASIKITTYGADQETVIEQETFTNSQAFFIADMPVENYYKVDFEFLETDFPYRRVRLLECLFGIVQNFDRDSLVSAKMSYPADLISESLPSRQLIINFDNSDHKYNMINPSGLYAYLQEGQDIQASIIIGGETVDMGVFEFMSASADDDGIIGQIIANDYVLLALDEALFTGGSDSTATLQTAVDTVLSGLDITTSIATPSYSVSMAIPTDTTKREAIRLLAQAAMCSVWVDRDGVLQIQPLTVSETEDDELNADRMESMGGISVSEPVDVVNLTVRNDFASTPLEHTYTSGTGLSVKEFQNPCVVWSSGATVSAWLLEQCNRRVRYNKVNRGNPAVEIGDTLKIYDAYGENRNAAVNGIEIVYDGGLTAITSAVGE